MRRWSSAARTDGVHTALVPTLGALHRGHTSLVDVARRAADRVAMSIFVNPLQFGRGEDFDRYPRDLDADFALADSAGVDLVFAPSVAEMYPAGEPWIAVVPETGADVLCGKSRPGHFRGVLTVVAKLFGIFTPDSAAFGLKDYQQLTLIRRMVSDLDIPTEILAGAIIREADGLAMSSRNRYLSADERSRALALVRALEECHRIFEQGQTDPAVYRRSLHHAGMDGVSIEYGEVVHPTTLEPLNRVGPGSVCLIAARVGATRLIDNLVLGSGSPLERAS